MRIRRVTMSVALAAVAGACGGGGGGGGGGTFVSPVALSAPVNVPLPGDVGAGRMTTGFYDGDSWPDVAMAHAFDTGVTVFLGNGDGTFEPLAPIVAGLPATGAEMVATAYLNLDPYADLVVVDSEASVFQTYLGQGDGTFVPVLAVPAVLGVLDVNDVQVGRVDGDVLDDVVFVLADRVLVYLSDGTGNLLPAPGGPLLLGTSPKRASLGQVDAGFPNATLDLAVADAINGTVHVLSGDGLGGFTPFPGSPLLIPSATFVTFTQLDLGSNEDLVVVAGPPNLASVLLGDGTGGFAPVTGSPFTLRGDQVLDLKRIAQEGPEDLEDVLVISQDFPPTIYAHLTRFTSDGFAITRSVESIPGKVGGFLAVEDVNQDGREDTLQQVIYGLPPEDVLLELRFGLR